jgi:hypothetical protein
MYERGVNILATRIDSVKVSILVASIFTPLSYIFSTICNIL